MAAANPMIDIRNIRLFQNLMNGIRRDIDRTVLEAKNLEDWINRVGFIVNTNPLMTETGLPLTLDAVEGIVKVFDMGVKGLPVGGTRELTREVVRQNTMDLVTRMGDDTKTVLRDILQRDLGDGLGMRDIAKNMENQVGKMSNTRAQTIARTETVRARNLADYTVAADKGYEAFIVVSADDCCEICAEEFPGVVFTMEDLEYLPPIHPNCRCTAQFFRTMAIADAMAEDYAAAREERLNPTPPEGAPEGAPGEEGEIAELRAMNSAVKEMLLGGVS